MLAGILRCRWPSAAATATSIALLSCGLATAEDRDGDDAHRMKTATPIKHVIVLIGGRAMPGPNFPASMQSQINQPYPAAFFIDASKTAGKTAYQQAPALPSFPAPNTAYVPTAPGGLNQGQAPFDRSAVPDSQLPRIEPSMEFEDLGLLRTGASGLPMFSTDTRVANATSLRNGSFQLTGPTLPYDSYTGDMVHRLFHMWQQADCDVRNA